MSKRSSAVRRSTRSSSAVRRSIREPSSACRSQAATRRLRGLSGRSRPMREHDSARAPPGTPSVPARSTGRITSPPPRARSAAAATAASLAALRAAPGGALHDDPVVGARIDHRLLAARPPDLDGGRPRARAPRRSPHYAPPRRRDDRSPPAGLPRSPSPRHLLIRPGTPDHQGTPSASTPGHGRQGARPDWIATPPSPRRRRPARGLHARPPAGHAALDLRVPDASGRGPAQRGTLLATGK